MRRESIECDRCGSPIKGQAKVHYLYLFSEESIKDSFGGLTRPDAKDIKDICSGCRKLIEKVLLHRKETLEYFKQEIEKGYKLPTKIKKRRKKNGKRG